MSYSPTKVQLPKIRKILPTNLVNIECIMENSFNQESLIDTNRLNHSTSRIKDSKFIKIKSTQISPKNFNSTKESGRKTAQDSKKFVSSIRLSLLDERKSESQRFDFEEGGVRITGYCCDGKAEKGDGGIIRRGFSGKNISKLYRRRNLIRFKNTENYL